MKVRIVLAALLLSSFSSFAQDENQQSLSSTMKDLSASMMIGGPGPDAYEALLHPAFTRWNRSGEVMSGDALTESLRQWWQGGFRVAEGESRLVHLSIEDDLAVARLERRERFVDRDGSETGRFHGFVTQVWVRTGAGWRLFSVDIVSAPPTG